MTLKVGFERDKYTQEIACKARHNCYSQHVLVQSFSKSFNPQFSLYNNTVDFWCQTIHKKFLRRFDTIFGLKMMVKRGLEKIILKFHDGLQSCCCPVQKNLPRKAELAWQVSRYL